MIWRSSLFSQLWIVGIDRRELAVVSQSGQAGLGPTRGNIAAHEASL
jgi:hypothetical protein